MPRDRSLDVAVTGLFGRFPRCPNISEWWSGLKAGKIFTTRYEREMLVDAGVPESVIDDPDYVPVRGHLENADCFDNGFFRVSPRDAELMDPQHRLMLEAAWSALEDSGTGISEKEQITGVYASGSGSGYLRSMLSGGGLDSMTLDQALHGTEPDFLASLIAYKLNLTGPAIAVQTACSSSLVSIHLAVQALLNGDCDQALVVAAGIGFPQAGHLYIDGGIKSVSGACRPFDQAADGVVEGSGVACVVLRRLGDALDDSQDMYGVIIGTAINNDGASKVGYCAPSASGQQAVIKAAIETANIDASSIGYLEAHATGTRLGDLIEWSAATAAYQQLGVPPAQIAVGALKANIGHLDAASGLASLIKTMIVLKEGIVPPIAGFKQLNPLLETENSPLFIPDEESEWTGPKPRRAGISAFGIGGTNAHIVVEQSVKRERARRSSKSQKKLVVLSAADADALSRSVAQLRDHLVTNNPEIVDVSFTLARRTMLPKRLAVSGCTSAEVARFLANGKGVVKSDAPEDRPHPCIFLFPGQGAQYPGMGIPFAEALPNFNSALESCLNTFKPDLRERIHAALFDSGFPEKELEATELAQPALFAIEYATAVGLTSIGILPAALVGHSLGEITAACVAGIFDLHAAARFAAARGHAMQQCPAGAMLALGCDQTQALDLIAKFGLDLSVAAVNTPGDCVVAGTCESIEALRTVLGEEIYSRRLRTSHAFHSRLVEAAIPPLKDELMEMTLGSTMLPIAFNATGQVNMPGTAVDIDIFLEQIVRPVRFADALASVGKHFPGAIAVEIGPGSALSGMAKAADIAAIPLSPNHSRATGAAVLTALGTLWSKGQPVDLTALCDNGRLTHLPTYPFGGPRWMAPEISAAGQRITGQSASKSDANETASGLPTLAAESATAHDGRPPDTHTVLKSLWEDLLGYSDLTEDSDFFDLGGDSLLITNLGRKIKQRLEVRVPLRILLSARTLGRQTDVVSQLLAKPSTEHDIGKA